MAKDLEAAAGGGAVITAAQREADATVAWEWLLGGVVPGERPDSRLVQDEILKAIREAGSLAETYELGDRKLATWEALEGRPVRVDGFHLNPSAFGDKPYAVVSVVDVETGEASTVGCGGENVLGQLIKAYERDEIPFTCALTVRETASKRRTYWLQPA